MSEDISNKTTKGSTCPICRKEFVDILKHFVLMHDIRNMAHLEKEIEKAQKKEEKKTEFRNYVEELKYKMRQGIISAEDYRELVMSWPEKHKGE